MVQNALRGVIKHNEGLIHQVHDLVLLGHFWGGQDFKSTEVMSESLFFHILFCSVNCLLSRIYLWWERLNNCFIKWINTYPFKILVEVYFIFIYTGNPTGTLNHMRHLNTDSSRDSVSPPPKTLSPLSH